MQANHSVKVIHHTSSTQPTIQKSENTLPNSNWKIIVQKTPMLAQNKLDEISDELQVYQLPEMVFDNRIQFENKSTNFCLEFNAADAIRYAFYTELHKNGLENILKPIKVGHAWDHEKKKKDFEKWKVRQEELLKQTQQSEKLLEEHKKLPNTIEEREDVVDWTFTSVYRGTMNGVKKEEPTQEEIDYERLKRKDPILFYDDIILYEDELHDFGMCTLSVKYRVMQNYFFILLRCFLRVDHSLLRLIETRYYHDVTQPYLIQEFTVKQDTVQEFQANHSHLMHTEPKIVQDANRLSSLLTTHLKSNSKIYF